MSYTRTFVGKYGSKTEATIYSWSEIVDRVAAGETFYLAGIGPLGNPVFTDSYDMCCGWQHGCEIGQSVGSHQFPYVNDQPAAKGDVVEGNENASATHGDR